MVPNGHSAFRHWKTSWRSGRCSCSWSRFTRRTSYPAWVRTSPGKEEECDLKPFNVTQRVRRAAGKGGARHPEASLAWGDESRRRERGPARRAAPDRRTAERSARWLRKLAFPAARSTECGRCSGCSRTAATHSSCRAIRCSSTSCAISSALYLAPPNRALVLSIDEKNPIQPVDRQQPVLPMMPGVPERRTHSYVRHGTTSLFATPCRLGVRHWQMLQVPPRCRVLEVHQRDRCSSS